MQLLCTCYFAEYLVHVVESQSVVYSDTKVTVTNTVWGSYHDQRRTHNRWDENKQNNEPRGLTDSFKYQRHHLYR